MLTTMMQVTRHEVDARGRPKDLKFVWGNHDLRGFDGAATECLCSRMVMIIRALVSIWATEPGFGVASEVVVLAMGGLEVGVRRTPSPQAALSLG